MKRITKILVMGMVLIMCLGIFSACGNKETKIRNDFLVYMHSQGETEMTIDDIKILNNYGIYNGAVVVRMKRFAFQVLTEVHVAGVVFKFSDSNSALVWKDGQFFELSDAYDNGILTQANLTALAKKINK